MSTVHVYEHFGRRYLAEIAERTVCCALKMIQHHVRSHLLVVESFQSTNLARVTHFRWFARRHFFCKFQLQFPAEFFVKPPKSLGLLFQEIDNVNKCRKNACLLSKCGRGLRNFWKFFEDNVGPENFWKFQDVARSKIGSKNGNFGKFIQFWKLSFE